MFALIALATGAFASFAADQEAVPFLREKSAEAGALTRAAGPASKVLEADPGKGYRKILSTSRSPKGAATYELSTFREGADTRISDWTSARGPAGLTVVGSGGRPTVRFSRPDSKGVGPMRGPPADHPSEAIFLSKEETRPRADGLSRTHSVFRRGEGGEWVVERTWEEALAPDPGSEPR